MIPPYFRLGFALGINQYLGCFGTSGFVSPASMPTGQGRVETNKLGCQERRGVQDASAFAK